MLYDLNNQNDIYIFDNQVKWLKDNKKLCILEEKKNTRTNQQNRARWMWLDQIAKILNERGETFKPKGFTIDVPFTKKNLYEIYWQTLRNHMYPNQNKQLDTKQFTELVEMAKMMFSKIFNIDLPFPDWTTIIEEIE